MTPQDIINAIICYCFLWPVIWLARKNPNFSHSFIQWHAKRATLLFGIAWLIWILFIFVVWPITHLSIGPFILYDILLFSLVVLFLIVLIWHAFRAYKWEFADDVRFDSLHKFNTSTTSEVGVLSEKEKIIAILSFIPYLGIWIASRFSSPMTKQWATLGTWAILSILLISIWFHEWYTTGLLVTLAYIILVVTLSVRLFLEEKWVEIHILWLLPSPENINSYIITFYRYGIELIKTIIGKEANLSYQEVRARILSNQEFENPAPYLMSPIIIGIPILNVITLPSYFIEKYSIWRYALLQWYTVSIFVWLTLYFSWDSLWIAVLLIPSVFLMSFLSSNSKASSPIIGLFVHILNLLTFWLLSGKEKIKNMNESVEVVGFTYENKDTVSTEKI